MEKKINFPSKKKSMAEFDQLLREKIKLIIADDCKWTLSINESYVVRKLFNNDSEKAETSTDFKELIAIHSQIDIMENKHLNYTEDSYEQTQNKKDSSNQMQNKEESNDQTQNDDTKQANDEEIKKKFRKIYTLVNNLLKIIQTMADTGSPPIVIRNANINMLDKYYNNLKKIKRFSSHTAQKEIHNKSAISNLQIWYLGRYIRQNKTKGSFTLPKFYTSRWSFREISLAISNYDTGNYNIGNAAARTANNNGLKYFNVQMPRKCLLKAMDILKENTANINSMVFCQPGKSFKEQYNNLRNQAANKKSTERLPIIFIHPETLNKEELKLIESLTNMCINETIYCSIIIVSSVNPNVIFEDKNIVNKFTLSSESNFKSSIKCQIEKPVDQIKSFFIDKPNIQASDLKLTDDILLTFSPEILKGNAFPKVFDELFLMFHDMGYHSKEGDFIELKSNMKVYLEFPPGYDSDEYSIFPQFSGNIKIKYYKRTESNNNFDDVEQQKNIRIEKILKFEDQPNNDIFKQAVENIWKPEEHQIFFALPLEGNQKGFKYIYEKGSKYTIDSNRKSYEIDWEKDSKVIFKEIFQETIFNSADINDFVLTSKILRNLLITLLRVYYHQETILVGGTGTGKTKMVQIIAKIMQNRKLITINCNGGTKLTEVIQKIENGTKDGTKFIVFVDEANTCTACAYIAQKMLENFINPNPNISYIIAANPLILTSDLMYKLSLIGIEQKLSFPTSVINFLEPKGNENDRKQLENIHDLFPSNKYIYTYNVKEIPKMIEFAQISHEIDLNDPSEKECIRQMLKSQYNVIVDALKENREIIDEDLNTLSEILWNVYQKIHEIYYEDKSILSYRNVKHFVALLCVVYFIDNRSLIEAFSYAFYIRFVLPFPFKVDLRDDRSVKDEWFNGILNRWEDDKNVLNQNNSNHRQNEGKELQIQDIIKSRINRLIINSNLLNKYHTIKSKFDIEEVAFQYAFKTCFKFITTKKIFKLKTILFHLSALNCGYNYFKHGLGILPVLLIARPGSAKSMSVECFQKYLSSLGIKFYCSTFMTSQGTNTECLEAHFYDCLCYQKTENAPHTAMCFLDELGFGNLNPNRSIKALHFLFDSGIWYTDDNTEKFEQIFPVGASNYQIDHAIQSRCLVLSIPKPDPKDFEFGLCVWNQQKKEENSDVKLINNILESKDIDFLSEKLNQNEISNNDRIKNFINNDLDINTPMRPFFRILMQLIDDKKDMSHFALVFSAFIGLGYSNDDALSKTQEIYKDCEGYKENYKNILRLFEDVLFDIRKPRSLMIRTNNYAAYPVLEEYLSILFRIRKFSVYHLYEHNFKEPSDKYAEHSSKIISDIYSSSSNSEDIIIVMHGNNPSYDTVLDILSQLKTHPTPGYNPIMHINGYTIKLQPESIAKLHIILVANECDLEEKIPLPFQDRLNVFNLNLDIFKEYMEDFIDNHNDVCQELKDKLKNSFNEFMAMQRGRNNDGIVDVSDINKIRMIENFNPDQNQNCRFYYVKDAKLSKECALYVHPKRDRQLMNDYLDCPLVSINDVGKFDNVASQRTNEKFINFIQTDNPRIIYQFLQKDGKFVFIFEINKKNIQGLKAISKDTKQRIVNSEHIFIFNHFKDIDEIKHELDFIDTIEELKTAYNDVHYASITDILENNPRSICVSTELYVDSNENNNVYSYSMIPSENRLKEYLEKEDTKKCIIITLSQDETNEIYHLTTIIDTLFNSIECKVSVCLQIQLPTNEIPDYIIPNKKWPVFWIDTFNEELNKIPIQHLRIEKTNERPRMLKLRDKFENACINMIHNLLQHTSNDEKIKELIQKILERKFILNDALQSINYRKFLKKFYLDLIINYIGAIYKWDNIRKQRNTRKPNSTLENDLKNLNEYLIRMYKCDDKSHLESKMVNFLIFFKRIHEFDDDAAIKKGLQPCYFLRTMIEEAQIVSSQNQETEDPSSQNQDTSNNQAAAIERFIRNKIAMKSPSNVESFSMVENSYQINLLAGNQDSSSLKDEKDMNFVTEADKHFAGIIRKLNAIENLPNYLLKKFIEKQDTNDDLIGNLTDEPLMERLKTFYQNNQYVECAKLIASIYCYGNIRNVPNDDPNKTKCMYENIINNSKDNFYRIIDNPNKIESSKDVMTLENFIFSVIMFNPSDNDFGNEIRYFRSMMKYFVLDENGKTNFSYLRDINEFFKKWYSKFMVHKQILWLLLQMNSLEYLTGQFKEKYEKCFTKNSKNIIIEFIADLENLMNSIPQLSKQNSILKEIQNFININLPKYNAACQIFNVVSNSTKDIELNFCDIVSNCIYEEIFKKKYSIEGNKYKLNDNIEIKLIDFTKLVIQAIKRKEVSDIDVNIFDSNESIDFQNSLKKTINEYIDENINKIFIESIKKRQLVQLIKKLINESSNEGAKVLQELNNWQLVSSILMLTCQFEEDQIKKVVKCQIDLPDGTLMEVMDISKVNIELSSNKITIGDDEFDVSDLAKYIMKISQQ